MIPYRELDTLFLDVGNTLLSMDFDWIARELCERGITCDGAQIRHAEALHRPKRFLSHVDLVALPSLERRAQSLRAVLQELPAETGPRGREWLEVARELVPVLFPDQTSRKLWSSVMPGVPEALARFEKLGLRLVVVSNADGKIHEMLSDRGLRAYFHTVIDSHLVGVEKPHSRIFEIALERCGAERARALHVGDLYEYDVVGARSAGVWPLLLDPIDVWRDVDCERVPDLLSLAARLEREREVA